MMAVDFSGEILKLRDTGDGVPDVSGHDNRCKDLRMVEPDISAHSVSGKRVYSLSDFPIDFQKNVQISEVTGCWNWIGRRDAAGYGVYQGKKAHRFACAQAYGPLKPEILACHRCDVARCVNPAHLFPGSHADNMRDMAEKGRQARGERIGKLTTAQALEILADTEHLPHEIADKYGIAQSCVMSIFKGATWAHLPRSRSVDEARKSWIQIQRSRGQRNTFEVYEPGSYQLRRFQMLGERDMEVLEFCFRLHEKAGALADGRVRVKMRCGELQAVFNEQWPGFSMETCFRRIEYFQIDLSPLYDSRFPDKWLEYAMGGLFSFSGYSFGEGDREHWRGIGISLGLRTVVCAYGVASVLDFIRVRRKL